MILAHWLKKELCEHPAWAPYIDTGNPAQLVPSLHAMGPANVEQLLRTQTAHDAAEAGAASLRNTVADPTEEAQARGVRLRAAKRYEESLQVLHELAASCRREHGLHAQRTQEAMTELGRTLREMGRLPEAYAWHAEVLRVRRGVLGEDHPYVLDAMEVLADTLEQMADVAGASALRDEVRERRGRTSEAFSIRENREFYEQYMRVFRNGVFRITRGEYRNDRATSTRVVRSYFSGAVDLRRIVVGRAACGGVAPGALGIVASLGPRAHRRSGRRRCSAPPGGAA